MALDYLDDGGISKEGNHVDNALVLFHCDIHSQQGSEAAVKHVHDHLQRNGLCYEDNCLHDLDV